MECVIHYDHIKTSEKLTNGTLESLNNLKECKKIRETLSFENHHLEQCNGVPENYSSTTLYYHRECYQKFTYARNLKRKRECSITPTSRRSIRLTSPETEKQISNLNETNETQLFPSYCMICKKHRIKVKGKDQYPTHIRTHTAQESIKKAASLSNDFDMLGQIDGVCLIAKEFKKHEKCYRDYTRAVFGDETKPSCSQNLYGKGDYDAVCKVVDIHILGGRKCISLDSLLQTYGIGNGIKQYRYNLKCRLTKTYGEDLMFLTPEQNFAQVVISRKCLETHTIVNNVDLSDDYIVKRAANVLRMNTKLKIQGVPDLPWPPTVDSLEAKTRDPPDLLQLFFRYLLNSEDNHHKTSDKNSRLILSFCSDVMYALSNGEYLTLKHAALALGLHSLTGKKCPIDFVSRMGHCINYNQVRLIETAQAELVQHFHSLSLELPLIPAGKDCKVLC